MSKQKPYDSFEMAFYESADAKGYGEFFDEVLSYLKSRYKEDGNPLEKITRSNFIAFAFKNDILPEVEELFWMILVYRWGDGSSRRGGYIYLKDLPECIKELELMKEKTWGCYKHGDC